MNNIKIFENKEFGEIRTVMVDGVPWFVGKDVAGALGYANHRDALSKRVDEEDKGVAKCDTLGGNQEVVIINESGLYSMIFGSKLDSAKRFKHWVTSDVLPSIRQTGTYSILPCPLNPQIASSVAELGRVTERIMRKQGSSAYKIAEAFKLECEQFGIQLPADFVKVPEYTQMALSEFLR